MSRQSCGSPSAAWRVKHFLLQAWLPEDRQHPSPPPERCTRSRKQEPATADVMATSFIFACCDRYFCDGCGGNLSFTTLTITPSTWIFVRSTFPSWARLSSAPSSTYRRSSPAENGLPSCLRENQSRMSCAN